MNSFRIPLYARWFYSLYNYLHYPTYKAVYFCVKRVVDRKIIGLMCQRIRPGMTLFDIGANIGFYSDLLAGLVGLQGAVHAFEPSPYNLIRLQETMHNRNNVQCHQFAVGEAHGSKPFTLSKVTNC